MSRSIIRKCDVCHKLEGKELSANDFVSEPLSMLMTNFDGIDVKISCNVSITNTEIDDEMIVTDLIERYDPINTFDEHVYVDQYNIQRDIAETQLEYIRDNSQVNNTKSDLCKVCFKNMLKMLNEYAKFDEEVKF